MAYIWIRRRLVFRMLFQDAQAGRFQSVVLCSVLELAKYVDNLLEIMLVMGSQFGIELVMYSPSVEDDGSEKLDATGNVPKVIEMPVFWNPIH